MLNNIICFIFVLMVIILLFGEKVIVVVLIKVGFFFVSWVGLWGRLFKLIDVIVCVVFVLKMLIVGI